MSLPGLEGFIKEQERLLFGLNPTGAAEQIRELQGKDKRTSGKAHGTGRECVYFTHNISTEVLLSAL